MQVLEHGKLELEPERDRLELEPERGKLVLELEHGKLEQVLKYDHIYLHFFSSVQFISLTKRFYTNILVLWLSTSLINQSIKIIPFRIESIKLHFDVYLNRFELVASSLIVGVLLVLVPNKMVLVLVLDNRIHRRLQDCQPKRSLPKREHR